MNTSFGNSDKKIISARISKEKKIDEEQEKLLETNYKKKNILMG